MGLHAARSVRPVALGSEACLRAHRRRRRRPLRRGGRRLRGARHPPLHGHRPRQRSRSIPTGDSTRAALALAFFIFPSHGSPGLRPLYRRPRSRKARDPPTIAAKAPPGSFQITTLPTRRPLITREGIHECLRQLARCTSVTPRRLLIIMEMRPLFQNPPFYLLYL
jgi:hypothetical protein